MIKVKNHQQQIMEREMQPLELSTAKKFNLINWKITTRTLFELFKVLIITKFTPTIDKEKERQILKIITNLSIEEINELISMIDTLNVAIKNGVEKILLTQFLTLNGELSLA